jgi:hypothetical protein
MLHVSTVFVLVNSTLCQVVSSWVSLGVHIGDDPGIHMSWSADSWGAFDPVNQQHRHVFVSIYHTGM